LEDLETQHSATVERNSETKAKRPFTFGEGSTSNGGIAERDRIETERLLALPAVSAEVKGEVDGS